YRGLLRFCADHVRRLWADLRNTGGDRGVDAPGAGLDRETEIDSPVFRGGRLHHRCGRDAARRDLADDARAAADRALSARFVGLGRARAVCAARTRRDAAYGLR